MPGASSDVPVRAGSHCLFASLRRMLADKYGLIMTEAEIYFRCDAMNVEHHPRSRPLWIGRSGQEMMRHFADTGPAEMDYEFAMEEGLANSKLLGRIQPLLASGEPVLLFVHSGSLTYHPIYRENPSRAHVICGYGWDERSGAIHVIDSFLLDYTGTAHSYQGPASYKELSLGVYGAAWMKEIYPHAVQPENGAYVSESGKERQAAFITLMKRRMMEYLQGSSRNDGTVRGLAAYDSLYRSLETVVDWDSAAFTDGCKELYYVLRIGSIMHQWLYLEEIVKEHAWAFSQGSAFWTEKLQEESLLWKKHLLHLYKIGLRGHKQQWLPVVAHGRELIGRQARLLEKLLADLPASL